MWTSCPPIGLGQQWRGIVEGLTEQPARNFVRRSRVAITLLQ